MTSAVGGGRGSPKSRQKEHYQMISVCDRGVHFSGRHIWKPPLVI